MNADIKHDTTQEKNMNSFSETDRRGIDRAHHRLDELHTIVIELRAENKFQQERILQIEHMIHDHMVKEEANTKLINAKLDEIARYRWVALGVIGAVIFLSGDVGTSILELFKKVP